MKKLLFIGVLACLAFAPKAYDELVLTGQDITVGTTETEYQFSDMKISNVAQPIYIHVDADNTGTIQFTTGTPVVAGTKAWAAGAKIPWRIYNGSQNLTAQGSLAGQKFVVTTTAE